MGWLIHQHFCRCCSLRIFNFQRLIYLFWSRSTSVTTKSSMRLVATAFITLKTLMSGFILQSQTKIGLGVVIEYRIQSLINWQLTFLIWLLPAGWKTNSHGCQWKQKRHQLRVNLVANRTSFNFYTSTQLLKSRNKSSK